MNAYRVLIVLAALCFVGGVVLFALHSFAYVAVLAAGVVIALGAAGARVLSRPSGAH